MKNFEGEPRDTNNAPNEDFVDPTETGETAEKELDLDVTKLFDEARDNLKKVNTSARKQKKQIVVDLAKDLEGKIAKDSISTEIATQLRGQVSPGFIRECLGEEYKQEHRISNARKRQKLQQEPESSEKLAPLPLLNQEEPKKVVMLGVNGRTMLGEEEEDDDQDDEGEGVGQSTITKGASITKHVPLTELGSPQPREQQEESEKLITGYPDDRDHEMEDVELEEELEEPSQSIVPDKTSPAAPSSIHYNESDAPADDILSFEFSVFYKDLQKHMALLFQKAGGGGKVWFSGKIDTRSGKVISSGFGKMGQQQD